MTITAPTGFAQRLKADTQAEHTAAEEQTFVGELLAGRLPVAAYADLLAQSYLVYDVLERAAESFADDREAQPFLHPGLVRLPSLAADLRFLLGEDWRAALVPLPATQRYVDRLQAVAFSSVAGLVAHHYLRYLGDLSGGQIIRRLVGRAYGFDVDGVRFYVFEDVPKPKLFKDAYRAALDAAPWSPETRDVVVAEVAHAFRLNADVFAELGERHLPRD